jgi:hypothetical protein
VMMNDDLAMSDGRRRAVILHYHLFKNAGTSLDALLKEQLPGRWVTREFPGQPAANRRMVQDWIAEEPSAACFSSHTAFLPPPEVPGVDVVPVIFVRHPLDRIASAYTFERQQQDNGFGATLARNTTLAGYIETRQSMPHDRQCRDFHVNRFAQMYAEDTGSENDRAMRALDALPFVGVVEDFSSSLERLETLLRSRGFGDIELRPVQRNVSTGRSSSLEDRLAQMASELGADAYDRLVETNAQDLTLYDAAVARTAAAH